MKIGFLGCGNMARAMIGGILREDLCRPEEIMASNATDASCRKNQEELGIRTTRDNRKVCKFADILVLSVKPQYFGDLIPQIRDSVKKDQLIISIAPGKTLAWLEQNFLKKLKTIRCMPNTPALVGEGMTGFCCNDLVTEEDEALALTILSSFGKAQKVTENQIDAVVGVSGSSPAYAFMMIEAMADGAVAAGMARKDAYLFAAQALLGSAKMVLETGKHPGELKDMVCSTAGTTIAAVRVLEEKGFRSGLMEAMAACVEKSRSM